MGTQGSRRRNAARRVTEQPLKPRLFIGSAGESKAAARKLHAALRDDVEATVWDVFFKVGDLTLDRLVEGLQAFDFAAFIFAPEDTANIHRKQFAVVRDNVLFEFGLFVGRLGRKRCFVVAPEGVDRLHLPTDLLALNYATYDANREDKNLSAGMIPAADQIRERVRELGRFNPAAEIAGRQLVQEFEAYLVATAVERRPDSVIAKQKLPIGRLRSEPISAIWSSNSEKSSTKKRV